MSKRQRIETDAGTEVLCAKCLEFWPEDPEFYYFNKGKPHSWCKACYLSDPKQIAKRQRAQAGQNARRAAKRKETPCHSI